MGDTLQIVRLTDVNSQPFEVLATAENAERLETLLRTREEKITHHAARATEAERGLAIWDEYRLYRKFNDSEQKRVKEFIGQQQAINRQIQKMLEGVDGLRPAVQHNAHALLVKTDELATRIKAIERRLADQIRAATPRPAKKRPAKAKKPIKKKGRRK